MPTAIVAGLGNPGIEYAGTRHNLGFCVLDAIAARAGAAFKDAPQMRGSLAKAILGGQTAWLVKPLTFMNDSGQCVGPLARFLKVPTERILVIHDDITLPPGTAKLTTGGGDGKHNGITSLLQQLPNTFARLRVGIGGKHWPGQDLADHVLGKLKQDEQVLFSQQLDAILQGVEIWLQKGTSQTQNLFNRRTTLSATTTLTKQPTIATNAPEHP
ncbi:MAG: aminoacyl-tRNA hydrolase [Puniceicoccales bacterium]|jgi:PTH1 family peptidyl-tRNA hydrolase|nr:aminoacyl-tRNA hydrolase [Puniceicoccales bacterium]